VLFSIQMQVDVGRYPTHSVPHGTVWSSLCIDIQEGNVAVRISLHGELDGRVNVEKVKNIIQPF